MYTILSFLQLTMFYANNRDQRDDGADIQGAVLDISGQRTVPNVFIKGKHLGGNDDTQNAVRSGKLQEMLK